jgi:hypothetical protein
MITHREILDAMGSQATDDEADRMAKMLDNLGIQSLHDISDTDFFALIADVDKEQEA